MLRGRSWSRRGKIRMPLIDESNTIGLLLQSIEKVRKWPVRDLETYEVFWSWMINPWDRVTAEQVQRRHSALNNRLTSIKRKWTQELQVGIWLSVFYVSPTGRKQENQQKQSFFIPSCRTHGFEIQVPCSLLPRSISSAFFAGHKWTSFWFFESTFSLCFYMTRP